MRRAAVSADDTVDLAGDLEGAINQLVKLAKTAIDERGAQAIVLGGAPFATIADAIRARLSVPVIEGVTAAVKHLQAVASRRVGDAFAACGHISLRAASRHLSPPPRGYS